MFSLLPRSGSLLQNTSHTPFLSIIHKSFLPVPLLRLEISQSRNHLRVFIQHQVQQRPTRSTAKQWQKIQGGAQQLLLRASTNKKGKDPMTVHKSIISSTKYSLRAENIWGVETWVPLNIANLAARGSHLPIVKT